jgi:hypothetical protein
VDRWFNIDAGFERNSAAQPGSNLKTFSTHFSGIRGDGVNNWDITIIKNTSLREGVQLQFRAEGINALNHPQFLAPKHDAEQQRVRPGNRNMGLAANGFVRRENSLLEREQ